VILSRRQALLVLNALPSMGPVVLNRLLAAFQRDPCLVLCAPRAHLLTVKGVGPVIADAITGWERLFDLRREEERIAASGVEVVTWDDPSYPEPLRQIPDPPIALYVKGSLPQSQPWVAIVGTRSPTPQGARFAREAARTLTASGITVVSGLARGIDAAAHAGALEGGGPTIGVIGSGLGTVFPPEHAGLYREVAENGAVISEFPFTRPPDKQTFPIRNRVVTGLSRAVLVVESGGSGGAMITANFAADYGRQVYAVPGRVDDHNAEGPHRLIREGATLCRSVEDLLEDLLPRKSSTQGELPLGSGPKRSDPAEQLQAISDPACRSIAELLLKHTTLHVDQLSELATLPAWEIQTHLLTLELNGQATRRTDGCYEWKRS
jgi:DNA processing protein